jgi:hypothetical protein
MTLISIGRRSDQEQDLEILILRHQLATLERKLDKPMRPAHAEKLTLAVLFAKLKLVTSNPADQLGEIIRIFQPETVLGGTPFFIELDTRRVYLAGTTAHPDGMWVAQQARQHVWEITDSETSFRFLIHDRDRKFTACFDTVFQPEGIHIVHTPFRAPNANAYAERCFRTVREECLDHLLTLGEAHLRRVLKTYLDYCNPARPHQGLDQRSPIPRQRPEVTGLVRRRPVLGGILNDYYRPPAYLH